MLTRHLSPLTLVIAIVALLMQPAFARSIAIRSSTDDNGTLLPDNDPFYAAPSNLESIALGDVIRARTVKVAQFGSLAENVARAEQLLYRTSYGNGTAAAAVTTVLVPYNAQAAPQKLVSHQMAEDATSTQCAPSFIIRNGVSNNTVAQLEIVFINAHLAKGHIVSLPDYELPESQYTVGLTSAHGTLDGLRAVLNYKPIISDRTAVRYTLEGYSGGALASGWAAQEQATYAKELTIAGAALGGLPSNITSILTLLNGKSFSNIAFAGIAGQLTAYATLRTFAERHINATGKAILDRVNSQCLTKLGDLGNKDVFQTLFYNLTAEQLYNEPTYVSTAAQNILGLNVPKTQAAPAIPLYVYSAKGDEIVGYDQAKRYVDTICQANASSVHFVTNLLGGHISEEVLGSSGSINFITDRLDGQQNTVKGCRRDTVLFETIQEGGLLQLGQTLVNEILSILGLPLGGIRISLLGINITL